jgi:hypothetical protein
MRILRDSLLNKDGSASFWTPVSFHSSPFDTCCPLHVLILNIQLTNSTEQSTSWEANSHSASQKILRSLWNPKFHYRAQKAHLRTRVTYRNLIFFYCEGFLAPRPTYKLEEHPLLAVRDSLFNTITFTLLYNIRAPIATHCSSCKCVTLRGSPLIH